MNQTPHALEVETNVIGQLLSFPKEISEKVMGVLNADCFYTPTPNLIFRCCEFLFKNNKPIDIPTVVTALKENGYLERIGGIYAVSKMTDGVMYHSNIDSHIDILLKAKMQRDIIHSAQQTLLEAYSPNCNIESLIDNHEKSLSKLRDNVIEDNAKTMEQLHSEFIVNNESILTKNGITGIPSGFEHLDQITGGWQKSGLIVLAANPGEGKSALALQFAANPAIKNNIPVAFFSMEMTSMELYGRLQSQETGIDGDFFTKKGLTPQLVSQLKSNVIKAPFYIDDTSSLNVFEFKAKARRYVNTFGVRLIILDYLQLMNGGPEHKGNREQEISYISRSLKSTAMELGVPIIALSQMNNGAEIRKDKRPQLKDLRESAAIGQNANLVLFIYRPSYHYIFEDKNGNSISKEYSEIIIAKHRGGALADIPLKFEHSKTKFSSVSTSYGNGSNFNNYKVDMEPF